MHLNPYLYFDGDCEAAFSFYETCFRGNIISIIRNGDTPLRDLAPVERHSKVLHALLAVGHTTLMGADSTSDHFDRPHGFAVTMNIASPVEADRVFTELSNGGEVRTPIQETFWAIRFGVVVDKFGTPWMINCERHR